jgi:hypothetical protein
MLYLFNNAEADELTVEREMQAELTSQILETNAAEDVWLTADGREFKIKDMDTMHIINTLNFLKRNDDYFTLELYEQKFKEELRNRGMYL